MTETNNKKKLGIACGVILALVLVLLLVFKVFAPSATQGAKSVSLSVVDNQGQTVNYDVNTDAEYLSQIFDEIEGLTVEGDDGEYGLYITTVNGLTADYDADGAYWSIYVNDEYGQYSADSQPVADGDSYSLVYTVYAE